MDVMSHGTLPMMMRLRPGIAVALGLTAATCASLLAQNPKTKLNELVRETQKQGSRAGRISLIWWVPPEFWRAAMSVSGTVRADKVEEMVAAISDVNVFIVVDGKIGAFATMTFEPQAEVEKHLSIMDGSGKPIAAIPDAKQPVATKNMLAMMKPLFSNMLGEFGKNLSFFVFEGKNKDGTRRIDPNKPGMLTAKLGEEEFRWRLPLGSLLPSKVCPKCGETFPGNYGFCPFDATPLRDKTRDTK
jgi:hypothetical protein